MYRARHWTMRQYAGFGTAAESNERYHYLLSQGQTGLSVAFDLPTQMGYDSNHSMAAGEVGKVGVAIDTIEDMELLLKDLPLDQVSTSMTINATASTLLALYVATAKRRGISLDRLAGTVQNDILKEYIARGTYIYPPGPSMRVITDMFAWCADHAPLEHHFDQRLSYPGGGKYGSSGIGFHPRRWHRLCSGCPRRRARCGSSPADFLSFSMCTMTCWKRSLNSVQHDACGRS